MNKKILIEFDQDIAGGLSPIGFEWHLKQSILDPRRHPTIWFGNRLFGKVVNHSAHSAREANLRQLLANATEAIAVYKRLEDDFQDIIDKKLLPPVGNEMLTKQLVVVRDFISLLSHQAEVLKAILT